jgi:hypothetical protein
MRVEGIDAYTPKFPKDHQLFAKGTEYKPLGRNTGSIRRKNIWGTKRYGETKSPILLSYLGQKGTEGETL